MVAYAGFLPEEISGPPFLSGHSVNISGYAPSYPLSPHEDVGGDSLFGARTDNTPISMPQTARDGFMGKTFLWDWYFRICVWETEYNLGPVLADTVRDIHVWNMYPYADDSRICSNLVITGADGISLDDMTAPFTLLSVGWRKYQLSVAKRGGPTIDCDIDWTFTGEGIFSVHVIGSRLTLLNLRPSEPMTEILEGLTEILRGRNGSEQRSRKRLILRQSFKVRQWLQDDDQVAQMDARVHIWLKSAWGFPVWPEYVEHFETIGPETTVISVDTMNADWRDNSLGVIWQAGASEAIEILSHNDTSLTLKGPVVGTYTGKKLLAPVRLVYCMGVSPQIIAPSGLAYREFLYQVSDNVEITGHVPAATYDGIEVLMQRSYIDEQQQENHDPDVWVLDNQTGVFHVVSDSDFNVVTQDHKFHNDTKIAAWAFRKFLHALAGRQGVVLVPTWRNDMTLSRQAGVSDTTIYIANNQLAYLMGYNVLRQYLAFKKADGSLIVRKITDMDEVDASEDSIDLDAGPGEFVPAGTHLCFVDKCRLASDRVEIVWERAGVNWCKAQLARVTA